MTVVSFAAEMVKKSDAGVIGIFWHAFQTI
jgi:hypothetical protein